MSVRLGPVYSGAALCATCRCLPLRHPAACHFGYGLTAGLAIQSLPGFGRQVHIRCPCGTRLASPPPSCWQIHTCPSREQTSTHGWETLSDGLHTGSLPNPHAIVGDSWSHNRSCLRRFPRMTRRSETCHSFREIRSPEQIRGSHSSANELRACVTASPRISVPTRRIATPALSSGPFIPGPQCRKGPTPGLH